MRACSRNTPATAIRFLPPQRERVTLKVFDVNGREVATLVEGEMKAGKHVVTFAPRETTTGIYFYKITAGQFTPLDNSDLQTKGRRTAISNGVTQTRKALLMK